MKKIYQVTSMVIATVIGAAFCSGKEISIYFAKYGFASLFFVPLLFVLLFFCFKLFLHVGKKIGDLSFSQINKTVFKKFTKLVGVLFFLIYIIISATMFAGIGEIGNLIFFECDYGVFLIITFFITFVVLLKNFEFIKKINSVLVPIIVIVFFYCCVKGIFSVGNFEINYTIQKPFLIFFSPFVYVSQNIIVAYYFLIKSGRDLTKKQINLTSFFSSIILTVLVFVGILAINFNPQILSSSMPFVMLSFKVGAPFDTTFLFVIFISIMTTLFTTTKNAFDLLYEKISLKFLDAFFVCCVCFLISFLGFNNIVVFFYPIIGMIGLLLIVLFFVEFFFQKTNSKIHYTCKKTKNYSAGKNKV